MAGNITFDEGKHQAPNDSPAPQPHEPQFQHNHHRHFHSKRLNRLIHPRTGKIFHVVSHPQEIEVKRHEVLKQDPKASDFDILLHGTDEHISTIRDIQNHHSQQREHLLKDHGETLSRYEEVRHQLDTLGEELHLLTDHAVALDASFNKFGYSAHLRTMGDHGSETASLNSDAASQLSKSDDRSMDAIRFWKQPVVKQYLHRGLVWRSPNASEVLPFELFIDLLYVGIIDTIGETAVHHPSSSSFLHYVITFAISWKIYTNIVVILNWFEINDIFGRLSVLLIIICLYAFTTNVANLFEGTYTQGIAFYLTVQMFTGLWWLWVAIMTKLVRPVCLHYAFSFFVGIALWIASLHVDYPGNLGLIFPAIFIDLFGATSMMPLIKVLSLKFKLFHRFSKWTEYLPAINIEHRVERTNAFTSLVLGYSVLTILFQSRAEFPLNAYLGKGILALIQAFALNWIYFEIDGANIHVHAIRRHWFSTFTWTTCHLPLSAGYILAASTLSELVIVHDTPGASLEDLAEEYQAASAAEAEQVLRWFYCGGLGVTLIMMSIISLSHVHKRLQKTRLRKRPRLAVRVCVAIVITCLPLAHSLNTLELIATTTCLIVLALISDIFGNSCMGDEFWTGGFCKERKRRTVYTANCKISKRRRTEMQKKLEAGHSVTLEDALRKDSMSSMESGQVERKGDDTVGAGAW